MRSADAVRADGPILFVRSGALGDFCLTLPVLAALCDTGRRVDVVCEPRFGALAQRLLGGRIHTVFDAGGLASLWMFGGVDPVGYATAIAYAEGYASGLRAAGVREVIGVASRPPEGVMAADHYCSAWPCDPGWRVGAGVGARGASSGASPRETGPIVIAPGSASALKVWPMERWRAVAAALQNSAVGESGGIPEVRWVGGPQEPWASDRPDLDGLATLAGACSAWLGPDSGPAHLAARMGAPVAIVGRSTSRPWVPRGGEFFDWDSEPNTIAAWVRGLR
jgi:hypothetical protein